MRNDEVPNTGRYARGGARPRSGGRTKLPGGPWHLGASRFESRRGATSNETRTGVSKIACRSKVGSNGASWASARGASDCLRHLHAGGLAFFSQQLLGFSGPCACMAQSAPQIAFEHKFEAPKPEMPIRMARAIPRSIPSRAIRRITSIVRSRQLSGSLEGNWQGLMRVADAFCDEPSIDRKGSRSGDQ
jgi:hypothetical protein